MLFPSSTIHSPSLISMSQPCSILAHPHDAQAPLLAVLKSQHRWYSPFKTLTHKKFGSLLTRAAIFINRAMLKVLSFLKPSPHVSFVYARISHLLLCIFFPSGVCHHQKLAINALISEHHVLGILNRLITYEGIAGMTNLMSTSFRAWFRVFTHHPLSFFLILSFRYPRTSHFDRPQNVGNPRYLPGVLSLVIWTSSSITWHRCPSAPLLNEILDFASFTLCPELIQYFVITTISLCAFSTDPYIKNNESS